MAVKKTLMDGYTYQDMFDTGEALDTGLLKETQGSYTTRAAKGSMLTNGYEIGTPNMATSSGQLAGLLNQSDAMAAFKKRKVEQLKTAQQGFRTGQTILGGGAF